MDAVTYVLSIRLSRLSQPCAGMSSCSSLARNSLMLHITVPPSLVLPDSHLLTYVNTVFQ